MEWLEGETLEEQLARAGAPARCSYRDLPSDRNGTCLTHERRIVHRDMKPGNIFVCRHMPRGADPKGLPYFVKVLISVSPGIPPPSALAQCRHHNGYADYMAPEQAAANGQPH